MQNRMLRAAVAVAAIGFVAACEAEPPTPIVSNDAVPDVAAPSPDIPKQASVEKPEARQIVVQAGQSVSRVAAEYGVSRRAIIAANDLTPPYKIKIGQQLRIPRAEEPAPTKAVAGSAPSEVIPLDRPALPGAIASPPSGMTASPAPLPVEPAVKPLQVAAPAGDKSPEPPRGPVDAAAPKTGAASAGSAELPAPTTTAAAPPPMPAAPAPPPGVTCPSGTIGMWSEDIIKKAVYVCHKLASQS